jgi:hypothetical protein
MKYFAYKEKKFVLAHGFGVSSPRLGGPIWGARWQ